MKSRRVAFAVPFVVTVACDRSVDVREPRSDIDEREERVVVDVSPPPARPAPVPYQLVEELQPLGPRPQPSATSTDRFPDTIGPVTKHIREVQRGVVHTRVRIHRAPRVDGSWRVTFITRDQIEKGECTIVEWDARLVECTTDLTPEQLVDEGDTLMARLSPPSELVTDVERAQAEWKQRPPKCCTNPPPPERRPPERRPPDATFNPPHPIRARVVKTDVNGDRTIVTVSNGSADGVDRNWTGNLVREDGTTIAHGTCTILRVDKRATVCAVKLTPDQVRANPFVRLSRDR